ncbi:MAG: SAM-dependent chlorinase/fluorinase [Candidatus Micrarchaeota archaeon]
MNIFGKQPPISIITDFGPDGAVWRMKTAIKSVHPWADILDIDHNVPRFNILCAAARLAEATGAIDVGEGSVFVSVVDPGVGTSRKGLVVRTKKGKLLVGPDNGSLSIVFQKEGVEKAVEIDEYGAKTLLNGAYSATFHGQAVFAPIAAHLAKGVKIGEFGRQVGEDELVKIALDAPAENGKLVGYLINIDNFGQLRTTIPNGEVVGFEGHKKHLLIEDGKAVYAGKALVSATFLNAPENTPIINPASTGCVDIALRLASASLGLGVSYKYVNLDGNLHPITRVKIGE